MEKMIEYLNSISKLGNESISRIYHIKNEILNASEKFDEPSFEKLIKLLNKDDMFVKLFLSEDFIKEYLSILFPNANKYYCKNGIPAVRYKHWKFEFNANKTIIAKNDYERNQYSTPEEILKGRSQTKEYRDLHNGYQYYHKRIGLKTYLKRKYPDTNNLIDAYCRYLCDKKDYDKVYYDYQLSRYNDETNRLIVKSKVGLKELEWQRSDYYCFESIIKKSFPNYRIIIKNENYDNLIKTPSVQGGVFYID